MAVLPGGPPAAHPGAAPPAAALPGAAAAVPLTRYFLAVWDKQDGRMRPLDPGESGGVPIPSFRFGAVTPAVGGLTGEGFYNTTAHAAVVWNGSTWLPLAPVEVLSYDNDSDLIADPQAPGSYAVSKSTGNFYVRTAAGLWKTIGIRTYPFEVGLLAEPYPVEGNLAIAMDLGNLWIYVGGKWWPMGPRNFNHIGDLQAAHATSTPTQTAVAGDTGDTFTHMPSGWRSVGMMSFPTDAALAANQNWADGSWAHTLDTGNIYHHSGGAWVPWVFRTYPDDVALQADTPTDGTVGVDLATGKVWGRTGGAWIGFGTRSFPTEVGLIADTAMGVGAIVYAEDTGAAFIKLAAGWQRMNSPKTTLGAVAPTAAVLGDIFYDDPASEAKMYDGTHWRTMGATPTGAIVAYGSVIPPGGWLLCDGSAIPATDTALIAIVGTHTPDLVGEFIRGTGTQAAIGSTVVCTTKMPYAPFVIEPSGDHNHSIGTEPAHSHLSSNHQGKVGWEGNSSDRYLVDTNVRLSDSIGGLQTGVNGGHNHGGSTGNERVHQHAISGGDRETAPQHYLLAYIIKT